MKKIVKLELCDIIPFENHPFVVKKDDSFQELKESIKESGLLEPLLVRPIKYGRYEEKCIFFLKYLEISKIVRTFAK